MPAFIGYVLEAHDLDFHIRRIEGIKDGFLSGQFPVRIHPLWVRGHGYASSIMYGEFFLYFPALLRLIHIPATYAYNTYIILVNIATVLISYFSFRKISHNTLIGLMMTVFYSANIYRLSNIYTRAAVGEYTAMTFLPLIIYGIYTLYTIEKDLEEYKRAWLVLAIGYSGVIVSHAITTFLSIGFSIIIFVLLIKITAQRETIIQLVKTFVTVILLNAWFIIPFIQYMQYDWVANSDTTAVLELKYFYSHAILLPQYFISDYHVSFGSQPYFHGMSNEMPLSVGMASALIIGTGLIIKGNRERKSRRTVMFLYFMVAVTMFAASTIFPWRTFFAVFPLAVYISKAMQFPWRFNTVTVALLSLLAGLIAGWKLIDNNKDWIIKVEYLIKQEIKFLPMHQMTK